MPFLTKQEKIVLLFLAIVLFAGTCIQIILKKYPQFIKITSLIENDSFYPKTDLNTASQEELVDLPYIGEYTARNIIEYRKVNGPFNNVDEVKKVKGVKDKNYAIFSKYLKVTK